MLQNMSLSRIYLNDGWKFNDEEKQVRIPHTCKEVPFNYFDEKIYQFRSSYEYNLFVPEEWKGKTLLLNFEGVAHLAEVFINDISVGNHKCGYTAFKFDISEQVIFNKSNKIKVLADSSEELNIPPFGKVIDYLTYGGIYRDVYLEVKNENYIKDVFVITRLLSDDNKQLEVEVALNREDENISLKMQLFDDNNNLIKDFENEKSPFIVSNVNNWDLIYPWLYNLKVLLMKDNEIIDEKITRFGFRECVFRTDGFYLNNEKIKIRGLNRHQSFPYVGYAMPKRPQQTDADILKYELGLNAVRTSHYPQSQYFLDRCDEIGLLVFTEIPGWQHIGDDEWKKTAIQNTREMILQNRNHPSIILWGVRINESVDDDMFYSETNRIAHELDSSRQTGGVRFLKKSSLLEDVYTYNDFLHNGSNGGVDLKKNVTPDMKKPYLVTEYNGHMYPTKSYDDEAHRLSHALRHANVLNSVNKNNDITGSFGWCMTDYNTHKDFGSGDRICYHGVMDMFRNPKNAAWVYASQQEEIPVCELSSSMDIGEHPGGFIGDIYAFTNADSVKLYKNDEFVKEFFPSEKYRYMKHPPIHINDLVGELMEKHEKYSHRTCETLKEVLNAVAKYGQGGLPLSYKLKMAVTMLTKGISFSDGVELFSKYIGNWGGEITTYRVEAIKDNKVVNVIRKQPVNKLQFRIKADTLCLKEKNSYDVATIRIEAVDSNGNTAVYFQEPLVIRTEGPIEIIGPEILSFKGGFAGTYIKSMGVKGEGKVYISNPQIGKELLELEVKI